MDILLFHRIRLNINELITIFAKRGIYQNII